ncbi:MAG: hypothetical protein J6Y62_04685 [Clostridia bacterium]|nr:hypothetical protein [Clostridia bacterium]
MADYKNKYPVILLHGMFGWGQQQATNKVIRYFGLWNKDIRKWFEEEMGVPCAAPSLGPFTSAWNRACEAYAQLKGGTVDYGKAHAEKYGMNRYGKTYDKPLLPMWGELDENGNVIKANLIGHSFGGVTSRMLAELIVNGSEEERAATDPDDLSPLFAGGHDWVHSITALAAPHNGMTSVEGRVGDVMAQVCRLICDVGNVLDVTPLRTLYDINLGMYGLTPEMWDFKNVWKDKGYIDYLTNKKDTLNYDLSLEGAKVANAKLPEQDHIYYFSYRGYRTKNFLGREIPELKAFPALNILGYFMGRQPVGTIPSKEWRQNDMVINTVSGEAPEGAPRKDVPFRTDPSTYKPGIWYVFPAAYSKDHMSFLGWTEKKEDLYAYYKKLYDDASSCPTINKF